MPDTEKQPGETKIPDIDRDIVYYYSREHRLSRASSAVRALNEGNPGRLGISKAFFGAKGNVPVFIAIVLFTAFGFASRIMGREEVRGVKLGGNTLALTIVQVEGTLLLGIVKNAPKSGELYTGAVDIAVSPVMPKSQEGEEREAPQVFSHRIVLKAVESEVFHVSLPFDGNDFFVILKTDTEQKVLRLKSKKQ